MKENKNQSIQQISLLSYFKKFLLLAIMTLISQQPPMPRQDPSQAKGLQHAEGSNDG